MSFLHHVWRTQAKLYIIYVIFALDVENTSQIIFDMSFLHHVWRTQTKLYIIYVIFAPDVENTGEIIPDICQLCTSIV